MIGEWIVPKPYKLILDRSSTGETTVRYVEPNALDFKYLESSTRFLLEKMDAFDKKSP